jgi:malate dehydrogenase (oxaloacetate-decarboxylating)(NADP+)
MDAGRSRFARKELADGMKLEDVVKNVKPTVLLGLSGAAKVFTEGAVREMAKHVDEPVIFPLSNPTSHCECTAEEAAIWTEGKAIFASGSPFDSVTLPNGTLMRTNQCNNAYCFPGMGLGILSSRATRVTDTMFQACAPSFFSLRTDLTVLLARLLLTALLSLSAKSNWIRVSFSPDLANCATCH